MPIFIFSSQLEIQKDKGKRKEKKFYKQYLILFFIHAKEFLSWHAIIKNKQKIAFYSLSFCEFI